jgi:hypothetical protein
MTKSVIMMADMSKPVTAILEKWPSRRAVLEDARAADPNLDIVAVHRWFQRGSVPPRHWVALMAGAAARGLPVSVHDMASAHAGAAE